MWLHLERCHIQSLYCSCSTEATGCPSREDTPTFSFCIDITSNMHIVHIAQERMKFGKIFLLWKPFQRYRPIRLFVRYLEENSTDFEIDSTDDKTIGQLVIGQSDLTGIINDNVKI